MGRKWQQGCIVMVIGTPLYLQNLPPGIQIRPTKKGGSIRLRFTYLGEQRSETLKGKRISKPSVEFAKRKLALIEYQIAEGTFNYGEHFPESKHVDRHVGKDAGRTVDEGLTTYLA